MLMRGKPFREWVAVYYDPKRTSEEKLVKVLHARRCGGAKVDRNEAPGLTVMNPCVGAGDVVQIRLDGKNKPAVSKVELPEEWELVGGPGGIVDSGGVRWITVRVPKGAEQGNRLLRLHPAEGKPIEVAVEVVRKVGE